MHHATTAGASCRISLDSLVEQVPDSQDVGSGVAQDGENVADTSHWCSGWSRSPPNSWYEEEKSNLMHGTEQ